jgi:hypothetical protein
VANVDRFDNDFFCLHSSFLFNNTLISTVGGGRRVDRPDQLSLHRIVLCSALPTHCLATHCLRVRHCLHHNHCPVGELITLLAGHSLQYLEGTFYFHRFQRPLKFVRTETSVPTDHTIPNLKYIATVSQAETAAFVRKTTPHSTYSPVRLH